MISGIIRSRPTNRCPGITITEGTRSITYSGDKLKIKLTSKNIQNISFNYNNNMLSSKNKTYLNYGS